jgi:hypothetical protein
MAASTEKRRGRLPRHLKAELALGPSLSPRLLHDALKHARHLIGAAARAGGYDRTRRSASVAMLRRLA